MAMYSPCEHDFAALNVLEPCLISCACSQHPPRPKNERRSGPWRFEYDSQWKACAREC